MKKGKNVLHEPHEVKTPTKVEYGNHQTDSMMSADSFIAGQPTHMKPPKMTPIRRHGMRTSQSPGKARG
jgi:hypothetical protein